MNTFDDFGYNLIRYVFCMYNSDLLPLSDYLLMASTVEFNEMICKYKSEEKRLDQNCKVEVLHNLDIKQKGRGGGEFKT